MHQSKGQDAPESRRRYATPARGRNRSVDAPRRAGCSCGLHSSQLLWTEELKRWSAMALIECHYGEADDARALIEKVAHAAPEICDSQLIRNLRAWLDDGSPDAGMLLLAKALCDDAEMADTREPC